LGNPQNHTIQAMWIWKPPSGIAADHPERILANPRSFVRDNENFDFLHEETRRNCETPRESKVYERLSRIIPERQNSPCPIFPIPVSVNVYASMVTERALRRSSDRRPRTVETKN
jgi:hypothetical protein